MHQLPDRVTKGAEQPRCPAASREMADNYGWVSGLAQLRLQDGDGIYDPFKVPLAIPKQVTAGQREFRLLSCN